MKIGYMQPAEELFEISKRLDAVSSEVEGETTQLLDALTSAVEQVSHSFSGSWLGYHSRVYYEGMEAAPPWANFSQEWGLEDHSFTGLGSTGNWQQYDARFVKEYVLRIGGNPNLEDLRKSASEVVQVFDDAKSDIISILESELADNADTFLTKLKNELEETKHLSKNKVLHVMTPRGRIMTRDTLALGQGTQVPPHVDVYADVTSIRHAFEICKVAANIGKKAASHLERKAHKKTANARVGTNVFIGHGRSSAWRELKDFVQDRLQLPWDEFNRVPVAGVTNIARLSEMLDAAAIALLVMTAEDEAADGRMSARMNVVHEAGLFQGRLGFTKAIVLLEDGCEEFSNIQGLGQIRFSKGNISGAFEEVRLVLEREGLLGTRN